MGDIFAGEGVRGLLEFEDGEEEEEEHVDDARDEPIEAARGLPDALH